MAMTEQEIRRALAICEQSTHGPWITSEAFSIAAVDLVIGYAATLRALLEARELLKEARDRIDHKSTCGCVWCVKVRAFLAEGESK